MNKLILILISVCIFSASSFAQKGSFSFSAGGGLGVPVGDWAGSDLTSVSGWASPGVQFNFSASYQLPNSKFGLMAFYGTQVNSFDEDALAWAYISQNEALGYLVNSEAWEVDQFLLGGFVSQPLFGGLSFNARLLAGIGNVYRPMITVIGDDESSITSDATNSSAFSYQVGAGFKLEVFKNLDFFSNLDYLGTRPKFEVNESSNFGFSGNTRFRQNIASINFSCGAAIKF